MVYAGYHVKPMSDLLVRLPGRTKSAIRNRAGKIGASRPHSPAARRAWDAERGVTVIDRTGPIPVMREVTAEDIERITAPKPIGPDDYYLADLPESV